jgi:DNA-binding PadR family transcriptional regulator
MFATRSRPAPEALVPLKPVEALILTMLTAGERHGYGIRRDIIDHTGGAMRLEAGNLYRSIRRLTELGLIDETDRRPARADDDERRRYYRLTAFGRRVLTAEMLRLRDLVRIAEARRIIPPEPV